jgi:hypothetical protein
MKLFYNEKHFAEISYVQGLYYYWIKRNHHIFAEHSKKLQPLTVNKHTKAYLHRTSTGIGFRAFGPFLIPLLWGEVYMKNKTITKVIKCKVEKLIT